MNNEQKKVDIYKCFIASPSDTEKEREITDVVFQDINKTLGEHLGFRVESKKWENDARPSFGEDAQAVISEQLLDEYQIFIGIMWNKFGTPTKRAGSGTEEEFQHAYKRHSEHGDVEIMFYFNKEFVDASTLDLEQLQKVREFQKKIPSLGGLYSTYKGIGDFQQKLKRHLNDYFVKQLGSNPNNCLTKDESNNLQEKTLRRAVSLILKNRLDEALCLFSNQPIVWVDPVLSKTNKISSNPDDNYNVKVDLDVIIKSPKSLIIKSPPLFGLTSLAHYLVSKAWSRNSLWVYLDAKKVKRDAIKKSIENELKTLNLQQREVSCIILDSWVSTEIGAMKLLRNICNVFPDIPIIVMQTIDDLLFLADKSKVTVNREFDVLHLLALPRNQIRKVVSVYNNEKNIGEEELVLEKVIKDLEVLNIHRTPLNCLTLLKVSENQFDESPVNRTRMLEMVLFVLFDLGELPTYKIKPDLKDCEYVLGRLCENLIRKQNYEFTREYFLEELECFCKEKLIDLEVSVVFDVLFENNIIIRRNPEYVFRASYWIYYFAAKRMYTNKEFFDYIVSEEKYVSFPEIVEFYTGIDRNRTDILEKLTSDIETTCDIVKNKIGLPKDLNPFRSIEWKPTDESLNRMQEEISEGVLSSKLPESVKDQHADKNYNQLKPYDQSIQSIFQDYSLVILWQKIKACSRALRNSDYVDPDIKRKLLRQITRSWEQISQVLFALTPILAVKGKATFEGQNFILTDDFGSDIQERTKKIILANPYNVVNFFKDDLFSKKMGPLLFDCINTESNDLIKHQLILLLILERPRDWKKHVEIYITSVPKNSFYLADAVDSLRGTYLYSFASDKESREIIHLIKMGFAKHEFGVKKPGLDKIKKISNRVLPKREGNVN